MPPKPADLIPVIGYIRVSLAREEMISPGIQRAAITAWAARTGRRIVGWVEDLDNSGRNFRRKVMQAIERIEAREAREIGVYRYDRWGRNAVESLANVKRVEMVGGQLQSATEPFDVETTIGKYSRTNAFAIAEMQSDLISENWKAALENRVGRGLTTSGSARFGYVRRGRVPDPFTSEQYIRRYRRDPDDDAGERYEPDYASGLGDVHVAMYDRWLDDHRSFMEVAEWLNSRGIKNTRGSTWSDVTVRNVMDSGFAAGLLRIHDPECPCRKPSSCVRRVYVEGAHEAILDAETWERYRKERAARAKIPPRTKASPYPLSGHILCGHCDGSMKIQGGGHPYRAGYAYRCSRWHHYRDCDGPFPRRLVVEREVLAQLAEWAGDVEQRAAVKAARRRAATNAETDRQRLSAQLAETDAALRRLMKRKALDGDKMPDAVYEETRDELLAERERIEKDLGSVEVLAEVNLADAAPLMVELVDGWDIIPGAKRREMLGRLIRHVKVSRVEDGKRGEIRVDVAPVWEPCGCRRCQEIPVSA
ncbi:recombinase family protein [Spirillospora sp. CA-128828]|uniref:recombinase family protein n=1 Tax=Spirillospora sp. CA-128828 TaxID=3240033 RepID=UPI003D8BF620